MNRPGYPAGAASDKNAPFNNDDLGPEYLECKICNDDAIIEGDLSGFHTECRECGAISEDAALPEGAIDHAENGEFKNIPKCSLCGESHSIYIRFREFKGFHAECDCGHATQFGKTKRDALDNWITANQIENQTGLDDDALERLYLVELSLTFPEDGDFLRKVAREESLKKVKSVIYEAEEKISNRSIS